MMWFLVGQLAIGALASLHVVLQDKPPIVQIAWILGIVTLPVIGIGLYMFFGTDRLYLNRERRRCAFQPRRGAGFRATGAVAAAGLDGRRAALFRGLSRLSDLPPTRGNDVQLLPAAGTFYAALEASIAAAREQIWISFYVWREDEIGHALVARLAEAARRGVEVRVMVDEVGSGMTSEQMFDPLEEAGGRFSWAMTMFPRRNRWFVSLRNHRKICVVDGEHGYIGGMNVGSEYLDGVAGNRWHDLQIRLQGPVVTQLAAVFADDWHFATQERLELVQQSPPQGRRFMQVVASGPDALLAGNGLSIQALIAAAERDIVLTTPYFAPDEGLLCALEGAAARGVRVRLLVSAETDMGPMLLLSRSFFTRLLTAGVEIYEYESDIHHTKALAIDDDLAVMGSINLDIRSFRLNYEVAVVVECPAVCAQLRDLLAERLGETVRLQLRTFRRRGLRQRLKEGFMRLLAPVL